MSDQSSSKVFKCPACGAGFKWQPQYAGRKITCKCGKTFLLKAPTTPATLVAQDDYDIAPEHEIPKPKPAAEVVRAAEAEADADADAAPSPEPRSLPSIAAAYPQRRSTAPAAEEGQNNVWVPESSIKHMYVPLMLILIGVLSRLMIAVLWPDSAAGAKPVALVLFGVIVEMAINVAVGLMGLFIAATLMGVNFGPIPHAARKMAAMAIFAGLLVAFFVRLMSDTRDPTNALFMSIYLVPVLYSVMLYIMFDLDLQEALLTMVIVGVLQVLAQVVIVKV